MELKVWVEGIQRIVCGVSETTTCQDVVFALAHATGKVGRFTLIERWRNNERLLAPNENPLKILMKWGEYSNDVQFILQRSEAQKQDAAKTATLERKHTNQKASSAITATTDGGSIRNASTNHQQQLENLNNLNVNNHNINHDTNDNINNNNNLTNIDRKI